MPRRIRALFINEGSLGPDVMGPLQAGRNLEEALADSGLEVRFRTLPSMSRFTRQAVRGVPGAGDLDLDLQAVRWQLAQALRARRLLREELATRPPDVLHVHGHTLGLLLQREMRRIPTVLSMDATVWQWHAMNIWRRPRRWSRAMLGPSIALERRALAAARRVIAYSAWTAAGVRRELPGARVVQLHPGISLKRFHPAAREARSHPRVLFVGGRFAAKGGHDLLEATRPLLGRGVELDIVTPAAVAPRPGVRVHRFEPGAQGLVTLFQQADVYALPTKGDAVPWSVLEAMACGVPVVAYDAGAVHELAGATGAGVVLPRGDVDGLRRSLAELLGDPERRAAMGAVGAAAVRADYNAERQAPKLFDLLREVAAEAPG